MPQYEISMKIEVDGNADNDLQLIKTIEAKDEKQALDEAREKVRRENPEYNYQKVWCWNIRRLFH